MKKREKGYSGRDILIFLLSLLFRGQSGGSVLFYMHSTEEEKGMKEMIKKYTLFIGMMTLLLAMTGCGSTEKVPEAVGESQTENNGSQAGEESVVTGEAAWVFQTEDGIYYWKYTPESFEKTAVFANYNAIPGVENQLVYRGEDGAETVLFEADGYGAIVIAGERIFYESARDELGNTAIRSCTLDGQDVVELGEGKLLFGTEDGKAVICTDSLNQQIERIEASGGHRTVLAENVVYLDHKGDVIYYQPQEADMEAAVHGQATLAEIRADGSEQKNLYTTAPDLYESDMQGSAEIARLIVQEEKIYFSYGSIAGSGMFFQGGKVIRMDRDGNNAEVVAGNEGLVNSIFSVNPDGSVKSEFGEFEEMLFTRMQESFSVDGKMYLFDPLTGEPEVILTTEDYQSVGEGLCNYYEDTCLRVELLEVSDDRVYYLADYGISDPENNIGWRTAYRRENGALLEKDMETGAVTTLFTY